MLRTLSTETKLGTAWKIHTRLSGSPSLPPILYLHWPPVQVQRVFYSSETLLVTILTLYSWNFLKTVSTRFLTLELIPNSLRMCFLVSWRFYLQFPRSSQLLELVSFWRREKWAIKSQWSCFHIYHKALKTGALHILGATGRGSFETLNGPQAS